MRTIWIVMGCASLVAMGVGLLILCLKAWLASIPEDTCGH